MFGRCCLQRKEILIQEFKIRGAKMGVNAIACAIYRELWGAEREVMGGLREAMGAERELWGEWIMDFCEVARNQPREPIGACPCEPQKLRRKLDCELWGEWNAIVSF